MAKLFPQGTAWAAGRGTAPGVAAEDAQQGRGARPVKPLLHPCLEEVFGALESMFLAAELQEELAGACWRLGAFFLLFVARL